MPDEGAADAVAENRHRFWAVALLDRLELLGDVAQRLVPGDLGSDLVAALPAADQRRAQPVGVVVGADAAGAARAEPAAGERVLGVALDLPQPAVPGGGDGAALPEAEVAEGGNPADLVAGGGLGEELGEVGAGAASGQPSGSGADLEEPASGQHGHDSGLRP